MYDADNVVAVSVVSDPAEDDNDDDDDFERWLWYQETAFLVVYRRLSIL